MGARDFLQHLSGAGLSVRLDGDRLIVGPSQLLTGELRQSIQAYKADLLALLKPAPPVNEPAPVEGSNGKVQGRVARLLAVGLDTERAEELSQWMGRRPAEADDRRLCIECDLCHAWQALQPSRPDQHPGAQGTWRPGDIAAALPWFQWGGD